MDFERQMLTKIADMYYNQDLTQNEIAKRVGYSRVKISRLLQRARETGVVKISIDYRGVFTALEGQLARKYGLKNVLIADANEANHINAIAEIAGNYLNDTLKKRDTVAVGFGKTMSRVVNYTGGDFKQAIQFSPLIGGHGRASYDSHSSTIAANLAKQFNGQSNTLTAPAFASTAEEKDLFLNDNYIQDVLLETSQANKALFSVGFPISPESTLVKTGYFSDAELKRIIDAGAICDIASLAFLNQEAEPILHDVTDKSIGITADQLKAIPDKICVAGGADKHTSVRVALKAGYIDTLITDNATAEYLMAH